MMIGGTVTGGPGVGNGGTGMGIGWPGVTGAGGGVEGPGADGGADPGAGGGVDEARADGPGTATTAPSAQTAARAPVIDRSPRARDIKARGFILMMTLKSLENVASPIA
jgi:hypothetical protein